MSRSVTSSSLVRNGVVAGIAGGLGIAAVGMVLSAVRGTGFWSLPNAIGGIALGPTAGATTDFGLITLVGVMLHMALSAGYGVFTVAVSRKVTREYVATAIVFGLGLWIANYYLIAAVIPGAAAMAALNPVWMAAGLHVLFGVVTGTVGRGLDRNP
jgi:hypothetical protein